MSLRSVAFNDTSTSGTGYRSSPHPIDGRDIMMVFDPYESPAPSDDFYNNTNYGGATIVPDPIYGEEQQTFTQSLIQGNTRQESLMKTMFPGKDYSGPQVNTQSLMRDANKVVTDGAQVSQKAGLARMDMEDKMNEFQTDWKQAKAEAMDQFIESAQEMGINPLEAADQMIPGGSSGKDAAMAYIAVELWAGGGTFSTAGKAYYMNQELSKADKQLSPDQQRSLLEDTLTQLQNSSGPTDTRMEQSTAVSTAEAATDTSSEGADWDNMEIDDLAEFLAADPDGLDQPEMQALMELEYALDEVDANHDYVREHYGDVLTADKMYASAEAGNDVMNDIIMDAEVVQSLPTQAIVEEVPVASQKYDSLDAMLAGDSVREVTLLASDTRFDSSAVQTYLDMTKVDSTEAKRQLSADIDMQFRAGMG